MQKFLFYSLFLLFSIQAKSQVLYLETFDNIAGLTGGGPGTYTFPPNMFLSNVDNLITLGFSSQEAWARIQSSNITDTFAFSTSFYSPLGGCANDFMWTPAIAIPTAGNIVLSWEAIAIVRPASLPQISGTDGYELRIMTTPPTGATGIIGNQLTNSTVLFSTVGEDTSLTTRTTNLNAYLGQTVYIGFRNNSCDKFFLGIDDIKVVKDVYDANVISGLASEYTQMPISQASIPLGGVVSNVGTVALTNVNLTANVYDASNVLVHTVSSTAIPTLGPLTTSSFNMAAYVPTVSGTYTIKYFHTQNEIDLNLINDTISKSFAILNFEFARDDDAIIGALGIGAGNGGYIGNSFTLSNPAYLYSIRTYYTRGYTNKPYASVIWNTNALGKPTTILASTDTLLYPDNNFLDAIQPLFGGNILLPAGTYVVTAIEFDSTVTVGNTNEIFTTGKMWVNWPSSPTGDWANVESFGAQFSKPLIIRMNIGSAQIPLAFEELKLTGKSSTVNNDLLWTNNEVENDQYTYDLQKSNDLKIWTTIYTKASTGNGTTKTFNYSDRKNANEKNYYRIKVMDKDLKTKYSNLVTLFNSDDNLLVELYPNPAKQHVHVSMNHYKNTTIFIKDLSGKTVLTQKINESNTNISLKGISSGTYSILIANSKEILFADKLIVE